MSKRGLPHPQQQPTAIRTADPVDARAIAEVHVRSWQTAYRGLVPDTYLDRLSIDQRETVWQRVIARGSPEVRVATAFDGSIAGWVAFGPSRDADAAPFTGEIEAIYLLPQHWGRGIGRALWLEARRRLAERHFTTVTLWVLADNARAIGFYRAMGFAPDGRASAHRASERDGKRLAEVRYAAALNPP